MPPDDVCDDWWVVLRILQPHRSMYVSIGLSPTTPVNSEGYWRYIIKPIIVSGEWNQHWLFKAGPSWGWLNISRDITCGVYRMMLISPRKYVYVSLHLSRFQLVSSQLLYTVVIMTIRCYFVGSLNDGILLMTISLEMFGTFWNCDYRPLKLTDWDIQVGTWTINHLGKFWLMLSRRADKQQMVGWNSQSWSTMCTPQWTGYRPSGNQTWLAGKRPYTEDLPITPPFPGDLPASHVWLPKGTLGQGQL